MTVSVDLSSCAFVPKWCCACQCRLVCLWDKGKGKPGDKQLLAKPKVLPSTLWNQESVTCFLKAGVNPASSGGSMLPSLCWFGVQAFNQLHLYCQGCKKKIAVHFCALDFVYVKSVVMFDFCGENNLRYAIYTKQSVKKDDLSWRWCFQGWP